MGGLMAASTDAVPEVVAELIARLNADDDVSGILCQLPVPAHMDGVKLTGMIAPGKDVEQRIFFGNL